MSLSSNLSSFALQLHKEPVSATSPAHMPAVALNVHLNRQINKQIIQKVESLGFKALVITVDVPKVGNRRHDFKNQVDLMKNLLLKDLGSPEMVGKIPEPGGQV